MPLKIVPVSTAFADYIAAFVVKSTTRNDFPSFVSGAASHSDMASTYAAGYRVIWALPPSKRKHIMVADTSIPFPEVPGCEGTPIAYAEWDNDMTLAEMKGVDDWMTKAMEEAGVPSRIPGGRYDVTEAFGKEHSAMRERVMGDAKWFCECCLRLEPGYRRQGCTGAQDADFCKCWASWPPIQLMSAGELAVCL